MIQKYPVFILKHWPNLPGIMNTPCCTAAGVFSLVPLLCQRTCILSATQNRNGELELTYFSKGGQKTGEERHQNLFLFFCYFTYWSQLYLLPFCPFPNQKIASHPTSTPQGGWGLPLLSSKTVKSFEVGPRHPPSQPPISMLKEYPPMGNVFSMSLH